MRRFNVSRNGIVLVLSAMMILGQLNVIAYAEDFDETVPVEETTGTVDEDVFDVLAGDNTMQDVAAYINYKKLYVKDINAIKWSFVLSQLAQPFEEDLSDVLSNDLVLQMRDQDISISTTPDVIDNDYVYMPVEGEYTADSVQFKEVWTTISQNIRYNSLLTDDLQHYTVKSFFKGGVMGKRGFISDYVFTDADGEYSQEVPKEELKNNIQNLYRLDDEDNSTKIVEYLRNPSLSLTKDPNQGVRGQRRLMPIFVGSEISNMYLQIGMMIYCKENTGDSMTYEKFISTYGMEKVYVDSFGNIAFYDSQASRYKIILPNACNTVFTSNEAARDIEVYTSLGRTVIDDELIRPYINDWTKGKLTVIPRTLSAKDDKFARPNEVLESYPMVKEVQGWSEKTFMYNKLLGSVYSTRRRLTDTEKDEQIYDIDSEKDVSVAHYSSYIGPSVSNRTDFRNSLILAKPDFVYLSPNLYGTAQIANAGSTFDKWFLDYINPLTAAEEMSYKYVPEYKTFTAKQLDTRVKEAGYLGLDEILFNSIVPNGETKKIRDTKHSIGTYASVKHAVVQNSYMAVLQMANDASIVSTRNMNITDASEAKSDGAIAFPIHGSQLADISDDSVLGAEGGFLEEYKQLYSTGIVTLTVKEAEYELLSDENKARCVKNPSGKDYTVDNEMITQNYSTAYLLKRDNRISNRYEMFPMDDITTLSYTWLSDYIPRMGISDYDTGGDIYNATQQFLGTASSTGSMEEVVVIAFNTVGNDVHGFSWCDYSMIDTEKTEQFYTALKEGTEVDNNPFYRHEWVSQRALMMGLYRNTDSIMNPDSPIKFTQKEKTVDIDALLQKINFGIDNPLTKLSNAISGLCQLVHNAISVGKNANSLSTLLDSEIYRNAVVLYISLGTLLLLAWLTIQIIMMALRRGKVLTIVADFAALFVLISVIPLTFNTIVAINSYSYGRVMQTANDKTTLVSVQKTVDTFINKDKKAEQRYQAYRQQFDKITDIYQPNGVFMFDGFANGEPLYKTKSVDEMANAITMKLNQEMSAGGTRLWYTPQAFVEVQKDKYSEDFSKFFYDYMMYQYLLYYNQPKFADTTYGSVASQIHTEDKEVALRIDKVLHNLKGGFNRMLLDTTVNPTDDITGLTKFMNSQTEVDGSNVPYLRTFVPVLDIAMRDNLSLKNVIRDGKMIVPYGSQYLQLQEDWRMFYYKDYETYLRNKPEHVSAKVNKVDSAIETAYENTSRRIKELVKYRVGEFSDTAIIYTSSLIAAQELAYSLGGVDYGVKDVSDLDKIFRVIYSSNKEDIYNEEAVMYTIQDRIQGGVFIALMLALYEITYLIVTFINIAISMFAAFALPICLWAAWRRKVSNGVYHCFIGMITQVVLQLVSLYVLLLPLSVMSSIANKPMTSISYWIFTLILLVFGVISTVASLKLFKVFLSDVGTMGGSIIAASIQSFVSQIGSSSMQSGTTDVSSSNVSMDNASVAMTSNDARMEVASIDMQVEQNTLLSEGETTSTPTYEYNPVEAEEEKDVIE